MLKLMLFWSRFYSHDTEYIGLDYQFGNYKFHQYWKSFSNCECLTLMEERRIQRE